MNFLFIFDESLSEELKQTRENFKEIIDYFTFINAEGTITKSCLQKIEEAELPETAKNIIRGYLTDERDVGVSSDIEKSVIKLCNYESQFKEVILITKKNYPINAFNSSSLKIKSYSEFAVEIKRNAEFLVWKSLELWRIQKFKGSPTE